jgi:integrase
MVCLTRGWRGVAADQPHPSVHLPDGALAGSAAAAVSDLRHSHATRLLVEGIHPKVVQERLGHSSIAITLDLYSHVIGTLQEDAAARLDLAFGPAIRRLSLAPNKTQ